MTDRGPSAEAGWGCGNVGMWAIHARTEARPKAPERIVHISTAQPQKKLFMKKPRRAVAEWKAPNRDRPPTAESVGSVVNPGPERETRTQRKQGLSTAFHALRAAENEKQPNEPKRPKSGTPSGFIIGSGRIGPGAALKRQSPNQPSTTRSRRDSTRILTSARYNCSARPTSERCSTRYPENDVVAVRRRRLRKSATDGGSAKAPAPIWNQEFPSPDGPALIGRIESESSYVELIPARMLRS